MEDSGIYFLLIRVVKSVKLTLMGKRAKFPRGFYIYIGSAQKNLKKRIERHRRKNKKLHWHIDYLLEKADVVDVKVIHGAAKDKETFYAERWFAMSDFVPVKKFGASDSKAKSHLVGFYTKKKIVQSNLWLNS